MEFKESIYCCTTNSNSFQTNKSKQYHDDNPRSPSASVKISPLGLGLNLDLPLGRPLKDTHFSYNTALASATGAFSPPRGPRHRPGLKLKTHLYDVIMTS